MTDIFKSQLLKMYDQFLRSYILGKPFEKVILRGGKQRPDSTINLHESIRYFRSLEKRADRFGWTIEWENWKSKKLGLQQWPASISVNSQEDLLFLSDKKDEFTQFEKTLQLILHKQPSLREWLALNPEQVLANQEKWSLLFIVVDFLIENDLSGYYLRNLPIPVHTKFIETNKYVITSLLQYLKPTRYNKESPTFDAALGIKQKPYLFTLRWLDPEIAERDFQGIEVCALSADELCKRNWKPVSIWVVENETALYMLPEIKGGLAICSKGKALYLLKDVPLFISTPLYYWGDLDEDGFMMLNDFRKIYPHVKSCFMDITTIRSHIEFLDIQPRFYRKETLSLLTNDEEAAFNLLVQKNGRLEQEKIIQSFVVNQLFDKK